jgi:hypothetical protein
MASNNDTKVPVPQVDEKGTSQAAEHVEYFDPKKAGDVAVSESIEDHDLDKTVKPPATARELVSEILLVEDDPSVNPWTFRMWFIGIGMSVFAG